MVLNKWIISNRFLRYSSFWWWYRLMSHQGFRFDDYHIWESFWSSLNGGWHDMQYKYEFEKYWGKGSYPPERIFVSKEAYDHLIEELNKPPQYDEKIARVLQRKAPWDD